MYVGDRWWLSSRCLKSVVSVAEQGCSLRRVGGHWRVRWSDGFREQMARAVEALHRGWEDDADAPRWPIRSAG